MNSFVKATLSTIKTLTRRYRIKIRWALDRYGVRLKFAIGWRAIKPSTSLQNTWSKIVNVRRATVSVRSELAIAFGMARSIEWQFWIVLASATSVMALMQCSVPFWYGGSDHAEYYWQGRFLLGDTFAGEPIPSAWHPMGMGLFHILSGTVLFDTWKGFIALCATFSVAIPVLFYLMVRPHSYNFALIAGLTAIVSMTPYIYATRAGSDHVYFFLHALLLCLCVNYFQRHWQTTPTLLAAIVGVAAFCNMVRPVGAMIFWIFIAVAAVLRPRDLRRLAVAGAAYLILMAGWVLWDRAYGTNGGAGPGLSYPLPSGLTTGAERRLAEAYFSSPGLVHAQTDEASEGFPRSQALRAVLRILLIERPATWKTNTFFTPPSLFGRYAGNPDGVAQLIDAMFSDRNNLYFGFIVRGATESLGRDAGLSLIRGVAAEHGTTGLYGMIHYFLSDPSRLLFGVTPNMAGRKFFALLNRGRLREQAGHPSFTISDFPELTADLGPANALIRQTMRRFLDDYPQYWPKPIAADRWSEPDIVYQRSDKAHFSDFISSEALMHGVMNWYFGPAQAGRLFMRASFEILHRYPKLAMLVYENFLNFTVIRYIGSVRAPIDRRALDDISESADAFFSSRAQATAGLTSGLIKELVPLISANEIWKNAAALHSLFYLIAPIFIFLLIASLPFLRDPAAIRPGVFLLVVYIYELISIAVFTSEGSPRYEASFYLLPLLISCILYGQATGRLCKRDHLPYPLRHTSSRSTSACRADREYACRGAASPCSGRTD